MTPEEFEDIRNAETDVKALEEICADHIDWFMMRLAYYRVWYNNTAEDYMKAFERHAAFTWNKTWGFEKDGVRWKSP